MAKKLNNKAAKLIVAVLEEKFGTGHSYVADKAQELADEDTAGAFVWATRKLDGGNLAAFAQKLDVSVEDVKAAGRVLQAIGWAEL